MIRLIYTFKSKWGNLVTFDKVCNDKLHAENTIKYMIKKGMNIFDYQLEEIKK